MSWRPLSPRYRPLTLAATLLLAVSVLIIAAAAKWVSVRARVETDALAAEQAEQQTRQLAAELQKFRLLPVALSEYPDLHAVLDGGGPKVVASLNGKLESLANQTDAAEIYVIARNGRTLAASNWREPGSFVGQNFSFRPYFRNALTRGTAELFAVGTVTGRPGFFIARRIDEGARTLGVIVVKIDFSDMEAQWSRDSGPTMVAESHGVVIITGRSSWRFRALHPLSASEREDLRSTMQFGSLPLTPLLTQTEAHNDVRLSDDEGLYRAVTKSPVIQGTRLYHFQPLAPARARAAADARLLALAGLISVVFIFAIYWRVHVGRLAQTDRRNLLEKEVSLRTAELQAANNRLRSESQRRMAADARWRAAREGLAQANRLGVIGQITTGIAHEINQPVAAIRAFAENARGHLKAEDTARTAASITDIIDLTDRIGRITMELRNFARRGTPVVHAAPKA
jgi:two-component system C4-dicarboxylate transport sensor histidine kinase DctB